MCDLDASVYIPRMVRRWLHGVKAAVLATLILCGGGGLPLLDVVLYHGPVSPHGVDQQHFESSGTRHGHGDYCKAGSQLPHSPGAGPLQFDRSVDSPAACLAGLPADAPRSANALLLPRPRAPPSLV
jgi:hypothetical protein